MIYKACKQVHLVAFLLVVVEWVRVSTDAKSCKLPTGAAIKGSELINKAG